MLKDLITDETYLEDVKCADWSELVDIGGGLLDRTGELIAAAAKSRRCAVVTDSNVGPLYYNRLKASLEAAGFQVFVQVVPAGESSKNASQLARLWEDMMTAKLTRTDAVVALGGGVVGDLAGFAAATILRGVAFVQIPTTLLAQVDSSVGGKVAIDLAHGKNLAGCFWQPKLVLMDPDTLATLSDEIFSDGMAEVIKYGCIKDESLFQTLESYGSFAALKEHLSEIIGRCVDIKRIVVEHDQFDTGERMLLNFGHTLAHTIEQYYQYGRESHGEAVSIGMYQLTLLAEQEGLTEKGTAARILNILNAYGLPSACGLPVNALTGAIKLDKKNLENRLNIVLLHGIGDSYVHPASIDFFEKYHDRRI